MLIILLFFCELNSNLSSRSSTVNVSIDLHMEICNEIPSWCMSISFMIAMDSIVSTITIGQYPPFCCSHLHWKIQCIDLIANTIQTLATTDFQSVIKHIRILVCHVLKWSVLIIVMCYAVCGGTTRHGGCCWHF